MQQNRTLYPALVLAILAPIVGELIPGSSPPLKFFHPFTLFFLCAVYGCSVLLIRELTVRWGKSWATVLVLGAAFGILYEGLLLKSIFDPGLATLGPLATYGRWLGVNWVWAVERSIYHAIFS